jgi:replicative DNA helicase
LGFLVWEMSNEQIGQRLLSMETGVDSHRLRMGSVYDSEWPDIMSAGNVLADMSLYIDDTPAASLSDVRAKSRRLSASHGLDIIIIDYLQLMSGDGKKGIIVTRN